MPRRTRIQILIDLLDKLAENPGQPASRLAMLANLAYDRLARLLEKLENQGIVERVDDEDKTGYRLTERGHKLRKELKKLEKILRDFGIDQL